MTKTENYQLNQWDPEDRVIRTDFNEDNAKIDAALQSVQSNLQASTSKLQSSLEQKYSPDNKPFLVSFYTGTGSSKQTISLGFTPSAVFLFPGAGLSPLNFPHAGGLALWGQDVLESGLLVVAGGFQVAYAGPNGPAYSNVPGEVYYYIAFR